MFFTAFLIAEDSDELTGDKSTRPVPLMLRDTTFVSPPVDEDVIMFMEVEVLPEDDVDEIHVAVYLQSLDHVDQVMQIDGDFTQPVADGRSHPVVYRQYHRVRMQLDDAGEYRLRAFVRAPGAGDDLWLEAPWTNLLVV
ncbi:MAG: hypothetical protein KDC46_07315 [Thermoleophilia bacterium]|nr:hypothetical protein [Thermoleophilia bacterium]